MQKTKWLFAIILAAHCLLSFAAPNALIAQSKSDLTVLFVGQDPENPVISFADPTDKRQLELYTERTGAFEKFLNQRFHNVKVVFGSDYNAKMSDSYDVTIFDTRPKALTEAVREEGNYTPPTFLPMDFDRPALLISENSPRIGEGIGLKLDWL